MPSGCGLGVSAWVMAGRAVLGSRCPPPPPWVLRLPLAERVTLEFSWKSLVTACLRLGSASVPFLVLPPSSDIKDTQIKQHVLEQARVGVSVDELRGNLVPALLQSKLFLGVT